VVVVPPSLYHLNPHGFVYLGDDDVTDVGCGDGRVKLRKGRGSAAALDGDLDDEHITA